jgi:hypothetical protein
VIDKLLFGSDFPYTNASDCIEGLYKLNQLVQGTNLPVVPREALRGNRRAGRDEAAGAGLTAPGGVNFVTRASRPCSSISYRATRADARATKSAK